MCVQSPCLGAQFYTPVAMEATGTPEFNDLAGKTNTFSKIEYLIEKIMKTFGLKFQTVVFILSNLTAIPYGSGSRR